MTDWYPRHFFRILQGGPGEILLFYFFLLFRVEKVKNENRRYNLPAILLFLLFVIQNLAGVAFFSVDPDSSRERQAPPPAALLRELAKKMNSNSLKYV